MSLHSYHALGIGTSLHHPERLRVPNANGFPWFRIRQGDAVRAHLKRTLSGDDRDDLAAFDDVRNFDIRSMQYAAGGDGAAQNLAQDFLFVTHAAIVGARKTTNLASQVLWPDAFIRSDSHIGDPDLGLGAQ